MEKESSVDESFVDTKDRLDALFVLEPDMSSYQTDDSDLDRKANDLLHRSHHVKNQTNAITTVSPQPDVTQSVLDDHNGSKTPYFDAKLINEVNHKKT